MALTTCDECNQEVSESASSCPKCGAKLKPSAVATLFKYLGFGISILIAIGFISYAGAMAVIIILAAYVLFIGYKHLYTNSKNKGI
jgi:prepilin signal peptidase PulO-like enzyme (type II secretory pathway)